MDSDDDFQPLPATTSKRKAGCDSLTRSSAKRKAAPPSSSGQINNKSYANKNACATALGSGGPAPAQQPSAASTLHCHQQQQAARAPPPAAAYPAFSSEDPVEDEWRDELGGPAPTQPSFDLLGGGGDQQSGALSGGARPGQPCPVCQMDLETVSDTEAGRMAHVNACLDASCRGAAAGSQPAPAPLALAVAPLPPPPRHRPEPPVAPELMQHQQRGLEPQVPSSTSGGRPADAGVVRDVATWLTSVGLSRWWPEFKVAEVDLDALAFLGDEDLQEVGVTDAGDRCRLLTHIAALSSAAAAAAAEEEEEEEAEEEEQEEEEEECDEEGQMGEEGDGEGLQAEAVAEQEEGEEEEDVPGDDAWGDSDEWACGASDASDAAAALIRAAAEAPGGGQQPSAGAVGRPPLQPVQPAQQQQQQQTPVFTPMFNNAAATVLHHGPKPTKITQYFASSSSSSARQQAAAAEDKENSAAGSSGRAGSSSGGGGASTSGFAAPATWQQRRRQVAPMFQPQARGPAAGAAAAASAPADPSNPPPSELQQASLAAPGAAVPQWAWLPAWRRIPGTALLVDCFGKASENIRTCRYWILTHFHADHYMGLTKRFAGGTICCTPATAALVQLKLRVPAGRIRVLPLDTPVDLDGTRVTLIDANHCPGAAMVVAEPPGGRPPVLHTGDCRLTPLMQQHPALQALRGRAVLVLDTTYCDPRYTFPPQQDVLRYALDAFASEAHNPRALFLFGTYTIGKERLFLEVARATGRKVYVAKAKMDIMRCLNLAPEYYDLLTTNHLETNLHAVPLFKVSLKSMGEILNQYKGRYNMVVGFQPTGWTQQPERKQARGQCGRRLQRGTLVLYQLPYSEHSSFNELRDFVAWLRPRDVIPSVNNDSGAGARRMLALLRGGAS